MNHRDEYSEYNPMLNTDFLGNQNDNYHMNTELDASSSLDNFHQKNIPNGYEHNNNDIQLEKIDFNATEKDRKINTFAHKENFVSRDNLESNSNEVINVNLKSRNAIDKNVDNANKSKASFVEKVNRNKSQNILLEETKIDEFKDIFEPLASSQASQARNLKNIEKSIEKAVSTEYVSPFISHLNWLFRLFILINIILANITYIRQNDVVSKIVAHREALDFNFLQLDDMIEIYRNVYKISLMTRNIINDYTNLETVGGNVSNIDICLTKLNELTLKLKSDMESFKYSLYTDIGYVYIKQIVESMITINFNSNHQSKSNEISKNLNTMNETNSVNLENMLKLIDNYGFKFFDAMYLYISQCIQLVNGSELNFDSMNPQIEFVLENTLTNFINTLNSSTSIFQDIVLTILDSETSTIYIFDGACSLLLITSIFFFGYSLYKLMNEKLSIIKIMRNVISDDIISIIRKYELFKSILKNNNDIQYFNNDEEILSKFIEKKKQIYYDINNNVKSTANQTKNQKISLNTVGYFNGLKTKIFKFVIIICGILSYYIVGSTAFTSFQTWATTNTYQTAFVYNELYGKGLLISVTYLLLDKNNSGVVGTVNVYDFLMITIAEGQKADQFIQVFKSEDPNEIIIRSRCILRRKYM